MPYGIQRCHYFMPCNKSMMSLFHGMSFSDVIISCHVIQWCHFMPCHSVMSLFHVSGTPASVLSKSATIDYAPTSLTSGKGQPGGHGSRPYETASRPTTLGRSYTADAAWGHPLFPHDEEITHSR